MKPGLALSIPGMAVALMAYPVYTMVTDKRKKEYADEIIRLSDEVMAEEEGETE